MTRPAVVCLCGSTRFREAFRAAARAEALAGKVVLTVHVFGHLEGLDMTGPEKQALDALHRHQIDMADEVLVLNVGGYVGAGLLLELEYARNRGKPLRFLEPHGD